MKYIVGIVWLLVVEPVMAPAKIQDAPPPPPPVATWCDMYRCATAPCDTACRRWIRKQALIDYLLKHPRLIMWEA